jgi:hypothetical protein
MTPGVILALGLILGQFQPDPPPDAPLLETVGGDMRGTREIAPESAVLAVEGTPLLDVQLRDGGCWMPAADCITSARYRRTLEIKLQRLEEQNRALTTDLDRAGTLPWGILFLGLGTGLLVGGAMGFLVF